MEAKLHHSSAARRHGTSEQHEDLPWVPEDLVLLDLHHIEAHCLAQRAALAHRDDVALLRLEARRTMHRHVGVALLETMKLLHVMEIIPPDDDGALHLRGDHHALQHLPADAYVACERALLVDIVALLGLLWRREAQADVSEVAHAFLRLLAQQALGADEDRILLLEGLLGLVHDCSG